MSLPIYKIITDKILEKLEQGVIPWENLGKREVPTNLKTMKPYRGINRFILGIQDYHSHYWLTFNQIRDLGGLVRKGSKGCPVIFFFPLEEEDEKKKILEDDGPKFISRKFTVFNLDCIEGIELPESKPESRTPIETCEEVLKNMPDTMPKIIIKNDLGRNVLGSYNVKVDRIYMKAKSFYDSSEDYYATLFHELAHSTGHKKRLNRDLSSELMFSESYSKEELIAEMTAAFLCGHCRIEDRTIDRSALYLQSWLSALRDDHMMLVQAASAAQKASDYILNVSVVKEEKKKPIKKAAKKKTR